MLNCVKECIMTSQCRGFNYRHDWLVCDLLGETTNIVSETGCIFSDIATWPKVMAGECRQHSCKNGERCIFNGQNQLCEKSYCIEAPVVKNAVSTERFGVYRNVGAGVKFKCDDGYNIIGWPYSVCLPSGEWENKFSCVVEETGTCPDEWILHNEHCYFFAWEELTWSQAKDNCKEKNSDLVKIEDENEELWIEGLMPDSKIWIGANDIENEGRWIWSSDNTTLQYFPWRSGQPDNYNNEEHCAQIFSDKDGGWNDIGCSERLSFTCERNAILYML
ncbi:unnamed protein product [Mytilus coruscus]|uniref:MRC n=1 Tax=Mytilus coruscus TaxID=42192 RepID=A0A6J8AIH5_MYTCO|nr:unnamed protein product [Mytilus coruscus]